jgi:multisubunit Na+/H+ antiporter MnhE subunit
MLFFVVCIVLCSFLYAQLFVGAVVGAFISRRTEDLSERQAKWFQIYKSILEHPPPIKMTPPQVNARVCTPR